QQITVTINGTDDASVVAGTHTDSANEGNIGDTVTASGALSISDVDGDDSPAFNDAGSTVGDNAYGSFVLIGGSWTYTIDQTAVQSLDAGDSVNDTITYTATDGSAQQITVTISGTDDASVVAGTHTDSANEGNLGDTVTATGTLSISDVDGDDSPVFNDVGPTVGDNVYGSFVLSGGSWVYTIDQTAVQNLDAGDSVNDTITYTATDGTAQQITVTINGTDDASVVAGTHTDSANEGNIGDTVTASGTLTISDVDGDDSPVFNDVGSTVGDNAYGSFVLSGGSWVYTIDQTSVQSLDAGDSVNDTITYTSTDGTAQQITVTINGTDDASVVAGTHTDSVNEGDEGDAVTATGTLGISDVDGDDSPNFNDVGSTAGDNAYGNFVLSAGNWAYTVDQSSVQSLNSGDSVNDTITYTATDGTTQQITVTINGTDEVAVPGFALNSDTGESSSDGITSNTVVDVTLTTDAVRWEYSLDGGSSWVTGSGTIFHLSGNTSYAANQVHVRQYDVGDSLTLSSTNASPIVVDVAGMGSISVDSVTADDVINAAESGQNVLVTGSVGLEATTGDLVSFTVNGTYYSGNVDGSNSFSISVAGSDLAADTSFDVNVSGTDTAGNVISSNHNSSHSVDLVTSATISVNAITADDVINASEAGQTISVAGSVGGDATTGDEVSFTINGTDYSGFVSGNSFSIDVAGADLAADGDFTATVTGSDNAGNVFNANDNSTHSIDLTVATPILTLATDTGSSGSDQITTDATMNVGSLEAGASWEYSLNSGGSWTSGVGSSFELSSDTTYGAGLIQVRQTDTAGNVSADGSNVGDVVVDNTIGAITASQSMDYSENLGAGDVIGTVAASGAGEITRYEFDNDSQTSSDGYYAIDNNGQISITALGVAGGVANNDYETGANSFNYNIRAEDTAGNISSSESVTFNLRDANVSIADIDRTTDTTPTISGISSGTVGDLTVNVNGVDYSVTPDVNGNWSLTIPDGNTLSSGTYTATVSGGDTDGDTMSFDVVTGSDIGATTATHDGVGSYTIDGWDVTVDVNDAATNTYQDDFSTSDYLHAQIIGLNTYNNSSGGISSTWDAGEWGGIGDFGDGAGSGNEWVIYENVEFGVTGNYAFTFEVATEFNFQTRIDLNSGAQIIGYSAYVNTGDFNNYTEVTIIGGSISEGFHNVGLNAWDDGGGAANIQGMTITHVDERDYEIFTGAGRDYVAGGLDADTIYLGDTDQANGATYDDGVASYTAAQLGTFNIMTEAESTAYTQIESGDTQNTSVADVADANAGDDIVYGEEGTDIIYGNLGDDTLYGGLGRDALRGGAGDDDIYGGAGSDVLRGDTGADTFFWLAGDEAQPDTVDTTQTDIVMDFNTGEGDVLDLSDLLQGESETAASLDNFLNFEKDGTDTIIHIDIDGDGSGTDWSIRLEDVDLGGDVNSDQTIIQTLLDNHNLNSDP
ncbi:MAG: hypothetical protein COA42_19555, partial [Alteromonadaceae bacterium]